MLRRPLVWLSVIFLSLLFFLAFAPVPIEPVAWVSPVDRGYQGEYAVNHDLAELAQLEIGEHHGPEDLARDAQGRIYLSTYDGTIVRIDQDGGNAVDWVTTGGRPLGLDFDRQGNLIVADAYLGLLQIDQDGNITLLSDQAGGIAIRYANNVAVAGNGKIYFSDASVKFAAKDWGGTYPASLLDLMEHGAHGRLLVYDPATTKTDVLVKGFSFANGVALAADDSFVLLNETGEYRVLKYWLQGELAGSYDVIVDNLPSFPDNITRGLDGRFWIGLVSPRNPIVDGLSDKPWLRKVVQRLPTFVRPKATYYSHVIAIDGNGRVLANLQDPAGTYPVNTSVLETDEYLFIGSLLADKVARLSKASLPPRANQ